MIRSAALALALASAAVAEPCRQALVLGLDVSGSVDAREYRLQLDGLARALTHPQVVDAVTLGPDAAVRLMVFEWSGSADQRVLVDWTTVQSRTDLDTVANVLTATRRVEAVASTALGAALLFAEAALVSQSACWQRTIDISGDGKSNTGPDPSAVLRSDPRVTVNALVIGQDDAPVGDRRQANVGELSSYFHAHVLRGPGAFVQTALGFEDYERAMVAKLLRELDPGLFSALR